MQQNSDFFSVFIFAAHKTERSVGIFTQCTNVSLLCDRSALWGPSQNNSRPAQRSPNGGVKDALYNLIKLQTVHIATDDYLHVRCGFHMSPARYLRFSKDAATLVCGEGARALQRLLKFGKFICFQPKVSQTLTSLYSLNFTLWTFDSYWEQSLITSKRLLDPYLLFSSTYSILSTHGILTERVRYLLKHAGDPWSS